MNRTTEVVRRLVKTEWSCRLTSRTTHNCDVLIVGGGPAGLAAACRATQAGLRVTVVDDNHSVGGQIWRGEEQVPKSKEAAAWFEEIRNRNIKFINGARVFHQPSVGTLLAETLDGVCEFAYQQLILATGARELFLPFPGWTLPNVMGAGGLQALVKSGLPVGAKKVVVAGSGPLLLAVAGYLREQGAEVVLIAEQAPLNSLIKLGFTLAKARPKALQALRLRRQLAGIKYIAGCWIAAAHGNEKLTSVTLRRGTNTWQVPCDYLACGFHLIPNSELAELLGCEKKNGCVVVDDFQKTSISRIYCAGESTGIGGLELSLVEGEIAGHAASGNKAAARKLFPIREKHRRFAGVLNRTFTLRDDLRALPAPETIVCRCEDVPFHRLQAHNSWREAKLHTRCGMGPCQGRICGSSLEFLLNWQPESVRPPVFPVRVESLVTK